MLDSTTHWPDPPRHEPEDGDPVRLLGRLSDESLELLEALYLLHDGSTRWASWAKPLLRKIEAELLAAESDEEPGLADPVQESEDFETMFKALWHQGNTEACKALRTIARVLGIELPDQPIRRTKQVKPRLRRAARPKRTRQPRKPAFAVPERSEQPVPDTVTAKGHGLNGKAAASLKTPSQSKPFDPSQNPWLDDEAIWE